MDLRQRSTRTPSMRVAALVLCVAAIAAPAALAKGIIMVKLGNSTPKVGQPFTVYVHTDFVVPANDWLHVIAVAPGKDWWQVVGTVTGDASHTHADIPHDGFEIKLRRAAPHNWRAVVRLPRPGRWRIVLPNGTHVGIMTPPPADWMPWVQVHR
jgi:hypothetical protein